MFCTGGIRCEKAGPFMQQQGFENIFQLDGGILKYFEDCGGDHYQGECFVFDQRVGVDPSLHESETTQCFACQSPLTPAQQLSDLYVAGKSCPYCFVPTDEQQRQTIAKRHLAIRRVTTPLPGSIPYENQRPLNVPREYDGLNLLDFLCKILGHVPRDEWQRACNDGRLRKRLRQLPRNKRPQPGSLENSAQRPKSRNLRPRQHQELNPANDVFELSSQKFVEVESMAVVTEDEIVRSGDRLIHVQEMKSEPEISSDIRILYEDEAVIVIHKPAPLPMHPSGRFNRNTLQQILSEVYDPQSPRPAHRLDANTAGLVLFTRTKHFAKVLQSQFELPPPEGIEKRYLARIHGHPQQDTFSSTHSISVQAGPLGSRTVDDLDGLPAHTDFRVLNRFPDGTSLLEVVPRTGRTNQIRVHLWHLHLPICGDATYRSDGQLGESQTLSVNEPPLCLLAQRITFTHPLTRQRMTFEAERPTWAFDSLSK